MSNESSPSASPASSVPAASSSDQSAGLSSHIPEHTGQILAHVEKYVGKPARVLRAVDSQDHAMVDIHVVEPSDARPFRTFVTAGMSDFAMIAPKQYAGWNHAELFLCLPTSWKINYDDWEGDENAWPLRILANIARLPHRHATWIWYGQTLPNGNPPRPLAPTVGFTSLVLLTPSLLPEDFLELPIDDKKTLHFFSLVPVYEDEVKLKNQQGIERLEQALKAGGCSELLKSDRKSVVVEEPKRGFWKKLFG